MHINRLVPGTVGHPTTSNQPVCGHHLHHILAPRRRQCVRAAVAEYQRSPTPAASVQPLQSSSINRDATATASVSGHSSTLQPTPSPSPAIPSTPLPIQPHLPAGVTNSHAHEVPHPTEGATTIQRLKMVASSLESIEEEEELQPSSPSPPSSPQAGTLSAARGVTDGSGHHSSSGNGDSSGAQSHKTLPLQCQQSTLTPEEAAAAAKKLAAEEDLMVEEISSCESWRDLLEILEDEAGPTGAGLTLFVGVKALSRMASLGRGLPAAEKSQLRAEPGFQALTQGLLAGVPRMKPIQLANSLDGFASLGVIPHLEGMKAYLERCKGCTDRMNGRDLATLLHAFVVMRVRPGRKTLDALGFRAVHLLQESSVQPQSLSMMVYACGMLDYKNKFLMAAAADAAVRTMPHLAPQAIANLAWAFAKLGYYSYAFQRGALQAYASRPGAFRTQEVCNLLWAATRQRFHPEDVLAVMMRSLTERAQQLRGADFANIFLALGTFDVHPGTRMLGQLLGAMEAKLTSLQPVELCNIYWGLGLMGEGLHPTAVRIASLLPDHYEANRLNPGLLRQVFTAYLGGKLKLANTGDGADPKLAAAAASISFPTPMMDAMKRAWMAGTAASSLAPAATEAAAAAAARGGAEPSRADSSSGASSSSSGGGGAATTSRGGGMHKPAMAAALSTVTKRALPQIMQMLGVRHGIGRPTADGLVSVDIALRPGPDRFLALQVVEEHEHTANTGQFLGPQRFQSSVLEANGWEVKHIMAKDLRMLDETAWPAFIAELLRNMGVRVSPDALAAAQAQVAGDAKAMHKRRVGAGARYSSGNRGLDMLMESRGPNRERVRPRRGRRS